MGKEQLLDESGNIYYPLAGKVQARGQKFGGNSTNKLRNVWRVIIKIHN